MSYKTDADVRDLAARAGTVTLYESEQVILTVDFVGGSAAAWDPQDPPEAAMKLAKSAFGRAIAEGPST